MLRCCIRVVRSPNPVLPNAESERSTVEPACGLLQASSQGKTRAYHPESGAPSKREPSWHLRGHRRASGRGRVGRRGRVRPAVHRRAVRRVPQGSGNLHSRETLQSTMYFKTDPRCNNTFHNPLGRAQSFANLQSQSITISMGQDRYSGLTGNSALQFGYSYKQEY